MWVARLLLPLRQDIRAKSRPALSVIQLQTKRLEHELTKCFDASCTAAKPSSKGAHIDRADDVRDSPALISPRTSNLWSILPPNPRSLLP